MTVGVLSFHGDVAEHLEILRTLKAKAVEVRSVSDLQTVTHLIIPGGESTVMARFLLETGVGVAIKKCVNDRSLAIYGTCAGAIILASKVTGKNAPRLLGLMNITVDRNAYGTQAQSFQADLKIKGLKKPLRVSFIRAPIITKMGKGVEILAEFENNPVLVKQNRVLAGTFHPEMRGEQEVHKMFLTM